MRFSPGDLPTATLEEEIGELAAHISAATCRWLALVAEFDRREAYTAWGFHSTARWLAWRCSLDPRSARDHVRVARALEDLPLIRAAFGRGRITYSKARALTRVATREIEESLLDLALHATAAQLDRIVRSYGRAISTEEAREAQRRRHLTFTWEEDGSLSVRGNLSADEGALLVRAIEAVQARLSEAAWQASQGGSAEPDDAHEPAAASRADALVEIAESALAGGLRTGTAGERNMVVVHVDADALGRDPGDGERARCEIEGGGAVSFETARRLSCDASVVPVLERDGVPVQVGKRTRTIPPAMRRALRARDGACRFPGCLNQRWVEAHHIVPWAKGGETSLDNLVHLCRRHHDLLHEGGFSVRRRRGGELSFYRPDGRPVVAPPVYVNDRGARIVRENRRAHLGIRPETGFPLSAGAPFDLGLTIAGLCDRATRARSRPAARAGPEDA